ncbi:hypothetical protein FQK02_17300 [Xanthomonas vasicola]|nr:hypothetical protein FQK02_17300 [Xanthomonas vasicola]
MHGQRNTVDLGGIGFGNHRVAHARSPVFASFRECDGIDVALVRRGGDSCDGNGESGIGNRESGIGNRESGIGNRKGSVLHRFGAIDTSQKLLRAPWWSIPDSRLMPLASGHKRFEHNSQAGQAFDFADQVGA